MSLAYVFLPTVEIALYKVVPRSSGLFFLLPGNSQRPTCAPGIKPTTPRNMYLGGQHELHKKEEASKVLPILGPHGTHGQAFSSQ